MFITMFSNLKDMKHKQDLSLPELMDSFGENLYVEI